MRKKQVVILFMLVIFIACADLYKYLSTDKTDKDKYSLSVSDDSLVVKSLDNSSGIDEPNKIPPELTPFFFKPLPINFADEELLQTIPGVGEHLSQLIIKSRVGEGQFAEPSDLLRVHGIGKKKMKTFAPLFSFETKK